MTCCISWARSSRSFWFMFLPGSASRVIDLPGVARLIRRVDMTYTRLPVGGTAVVTVEGYKL